MNKRNLIIWVVGFWIIATLSFVWYMEYVKNYWETIIIKVEPVDPRDILRWDYVILWFPSLIPNTEFLDNEEIYVTFTKWSDNRIVWNPIFSGTKPLDKPFLKWTRQKTEWSSGRLTYWFENFYVPEWRWKEIESAIRDKQAEAEIAIDSSWRWIVKNLYIWGKIWKP